MTRALCLILCLVPFGALYAAEDQSARIGIRVIYALKDEAKSIDPALDDIRSELSELPFSKFRLLDRLETSAGLNASVELQFADRQYIAVAFRGIDLRTGKRMLSLELHLKPVLKIELRVTDGGRTLLMGPPYLDGTLIFDVSARLEGGEPLPAGRDKEKDK